MNEGENVRHLYGVALAVIMTAVMFFAGAWGYLRLLKLPVPAGQAAALPAGGGSQFTNGSLLLALAAVLGAAVLAGLLVVVRRISPLAAGLPGVLLLAWTGLYLASVRRAVDFIPLRSDSFGAGWEALLFNGVLGAAGAVMIFPLFIPSRWREPRRADDVTLDAPVSEPDDYLADVGMGAEARRQEEMPTLTGTVLSRPVGDANRVDTTRVTGASRALRNTGSFRVSTGTNPRATGSFGSSADTSLLGRPYYPPPGE